MPLWLLGLGGWLKSAFSAAFGLARQYPLQMALIACLCLSAWLWHGRNEAREELAQRIATEKAATGAQARVNQAATEHYREVANVADTKHDEMVDRAWDATRQYVATHRLQPQDRTCEAPAAPGGDGAQVPAPVPANPDVAVSELDVRRCSEATAYAVSAYEWANSLKLPAPTVPPE